MKALEKKIEQPLPINSINQIHRSIYEQLWSPTLHTFLSNDTGLDYQPLFGKMSPHSSPLSSGRIKDQTRETGEILPLMTPHKK